MRNILTIVCITLSSFSCAQNTFSYLGTLILSNNRTISFSLELHEDNGIVKGYSTTNINTPDETKSVINGLYFKNDDSFQLQESQIISTQSEAALNTFCYINMNLKLKKKFGNKHLEGSFIGYFLDSTECASGKIILIERSKVDRKIKKMRKKVKKKIKIKKEKINTTKVLQTKVLKDGDDFTINWESNKLKLFIWDPNKEDGDRINLIINNNIILNNIETTSRRRKIQYALQDGENTIEIRVANLGTSPPNTSQIELIDSKIKYPIITQLKLGKAAIIKIIK
jgi:hypothetical protein